MADQTKKKPSVREGEGVGCIFSRKTHCLSLQSQAQSPWDLCQQLVAGRDSGGMESFSGVVNQIPDFWLKKNANPPKSLQRSTADKEPEDSGLEIVSPCRILCPLFSKIIDV